MRIWGIGKRIKYCVLKRGVELGNIKEDDKVVDFGTNNYIFEYIMFCMSVFTLVLIGGLKLLEPTVAKMHKHVVMPVTFRDGLLNYVGSVTDYYNILLKVKSTNTLESYLLIVGIIVMMLLVMHLLKKSNIRYIKKQLDENKMSEEEYNHTCNQLSGIFKIGCGVLVLTVILLCNLSWIMIKCNTVALSNEINNEFLEKAISKIDLERRLGVVTRDTGEKRLKVSKDALAKGLLINDYEYTVNELKESGKLGVIYVLNELYYKVSEGDTYFEYSTIKQ